MAYQQTVWEKGMVIDDSSLNNIEKGVHAALNILQSLTTYEYDGNTVPAVGTNLQNQLKIVANNGIDVKSNMYVGDSTQLSNYETRLYTNTTNYGSFTVGTSDATSNTTLYGDLDVIGELSVGKEGAKKTTLNGATSIKGSFTVGGQNDVMNSDKAVTLYYDLFAYGNSTIGTAVTNDNSTTRTTTTIKSNTSIEGTLTAPNITGETKISGGKLIATGHTVFGSATTANGVTTYSTSLIRSNTTISGTLNATNDCEFGTATTQNGSTTYSSAIFNADTTINGSLTTANVEINGSLLINDTQNPNTTQSSKCNLIVGTQNAITETDRKGNIVYGNNHTVRSNNSIVGGTRCTINGNNTTAIGLGLIAYDGQFVFGQYNATPGSGYIEIVGNGAGATDSSRSNARTLDMNGNEWLAGNLTVSGNLILNSTPSSNSHAVTKSYVDNALTNTLSGCEFTGVVTFDETPSFIKPINLNNGFVISTSTTPSFSLQAYQAKESILVSDTEDQVWASVLTYYSADKQLVLGEAIRTHQTDIYGSEINFHLSDNSGNISTYTIPAPPNQDGDYTLKLTRATENNITTNTFEWIAVPQGE